MATPCFGWLVIGGSCGGCRAPRAAEAEWTDQWNQLLAQRGVRRAIPLRVTVDLGPVLCRLPRGYELLLPEVFWRELDAAGRAAILRHELAHYLRGDVWTSLVARLLALPHWFNPASWWAVRRFDEAAEWACDRAGIGDEPATAYAAALLRLGELAQPPAAFGRAARGRPLAARIRRLLGPSNAQGFDHENLRTGRRWFAAGRRCRWCGWNWLPRSRRRPPARRTRRSSRRRIRRGWSSSRSVKRRGRRSALI